MPRRPHPFDEKRAQIAALADGPPGAAAELRRVLGDKSGFIAGEAAEIAAKLDLRDLRADIAAAFVRLMDEGQAADKGCLGKRKILEALLALEAHEPDAYLRGLRYVQEEPAFGGKVDSAGPLRGLSAHALVQIDHPTAIADITPLLVDPEPVARAEAAHALGRSGILAAGPVLHLKVLAGDPEPDVLQNAYRGLLRLDSQRYLPVVSAALRREEPVAEAAALALGESRLPEAIPILKQALDLASLPAERKSLLIAISVSRTDAALDLLFSMVASAPEAQAAAALEALALHRHDARIADRARAAVEARGGKKLRDALRDHLG